MKRLFSEHTLRNVVDLDGAWKFLKDENGTGEQNGYQNGLPCSETVIVPSVWNNELSMLTFEGCGWYERKFTTKGGTIRLEFGSVMTKARVFLDGELVGTHYGAFSQFEIIVNNVSNHYTDN